MACCQAGFGERRILYMRNLRRCAMAMIENVTPILRVEDLEASRRYYIQTLGFSLDWDACRMISVSRDRKSIMLCEGEQGQTGTWLWIGVEDADVFFAGPAGTFTGSCDPLPLLLTFRLSNRGNRVAKMISLTVTGHRISPGERYPQKSCQRLDFVVERGVSHRKKRV